MARVLGAGYSEPNGRSCGVTIDCISCMDSPRSMRQATIQTAVSDDSCSNYTLDTWREARPTQGKSRRVTPPTVCDVGTVTWLVQTQAHQTRLPLAPPFRSCVG
jgi:hypothetical protein